jgi:two-component system, OmpR family, response regulator
MNVLLVEDDVALGDAVASYLGVKGFAVERAASLRQAQAAVAATPWDVVLLDLHLPDGDGLSLIRAVRDRSAAASVIVLTARDHVTDRIRGLDAGADDYLVKPFDPDELMARLRAVERCRNGGTSSLVKAGALAIDLAALAVTRNGNPIPLTAKEWSLLRVLATRLDRIQQKESLQKALYGIADEATSNTLEVFICNLRRKLGPDSIQTVRGLGYRLTGGKG